MAKYIFKVEEVSRDGYIAWDVIEKASGVRFPVNEEGYFTAGSFPEITGYLKKEYQLEHTIQYINSSIDSFDQPSNTWIFKRQGDTVVVIDIPRTVFRISTVKRVKEVRAAKGVSTH